MPNPTSTYPSARPIILKFQFIDLPTQYQAIRKEIDSAITGVLNHGQYIMGPEVTELESRLAKYIGVKHVVSCSSGTDALLLPLLAKKLKKTDVVLTSPFTFFASAEAISLAGGTPAFVDIDKRTYNIDPTKLEKKIAALKEEGFEPVGIMPVDIFGIASDYDQISLVAEKHDLFVIEDAAQAFGAQYKSRKAGGLAEVAATSFYPAKPLGCYGDGGAIFTDDSDLYEVLLSLRVHGQSRAGNKYDNVLIGTNARMDTIQAAVLLEKLKIYDQELAKRNEVAELYNLLLGDAVVTPHVPKDQSSVWAQYSIQVPDRAKTIKHLSDAGIPTAVFYPTPVHLSTAYSHLGYTQGDLPICEAISNNILSLPMHPYLASDQVEYICQHVLKSL